MKLVNKLRKRHLDTYQISYVNIEERREGYDDKRVILENYLHFEKFKRPEGMNEEEIYKVISYMYKKAYMDLLMKAEPFSKTDVLKIVNANLKNFHFHVLGFSLDETKNLFVLEGKAGWTKTLKYKIAGEKWMKDVDRAEVEKIYNNLDLRLPELQVEDRAICETELVRTLK